MKIKTISANYERKLNLGNYQSATVGCTAWADIDPETEDPEICARALFGFVRANVREQAAAILPNSHGEKPV